LGHIREFRPIEPTILVRGRVLLAVLVQRARNVEVWGRFWLFQGVVVHLHYVIK
jgi:hypothetical protein